jgi:two-component system, chemotaxis family, CheB/CheR fusion protein
LSSASGPVTTQESARLRVVGIGASAGGLESLEQFFANLPPNSGMAYVVIQHLSPDFRSMMDELLARHSDMPIRLAEHGIEVEANHVYLLPPKKEMVIANRRLLLTDKERVHGLTLPIDVFLRSLAQDLGAAAVAIILSGTGSDGSRGVRDIKRAGGRVYVESPDSANFDGMPRSALATGVVDHTAPANELPRFLAGGNDLAAAGNAEQISEDETPMDSVFRLLRDQFALDFSMYKTGTVSRRILRRLELVGCNDLEDYAQRLRTDPRELSALYHDLLIGVTRFFRDPDAFEVLEKTVIPEILQRVPDGEEIRVWVAACATGEEAYSLAMILFEQLTAADRQLNVKILSTDVHAASLAHASAGVYGEEQLEHVSETRRERFFRKKSTGYHISQDLRQLIVFAPHNLIKDAPFTKMHLISCRNLLIYLEPPAQKAVLGLFHFGLVTNGLLFLGSSESPGALAHEFDTVHEHSKIYRKKRDVRLLEPLKLPMRKAPVSSFGNVRSSMTDAQLLPIYDQLLDRHMPPSFLVDEDRHLIDSFGGAEHLFKVSRRRPSMNVLDLLEGDLRTVVAGAIQRALKREEPVRYSGVAIPDGTSFRRGMLSAEVLTNPRTGSTNVLIAIESDPGAQQRQPLPEAHVPANLASHEHMVTLEGELSYTRETLQSTIEELQTSNEELQASNEELVASNEELQSTNEELHSVNEELYSVNAELQRKIAELRELNSDMQHFLESTDVGTLFLDRRMCIRKYTPRIASVVHIEPQDIGRNIGHFAHSLNRPTLLQDIQRVLDDGAVIEDEVRDGNGTTYFLRILPYIAGTADNSHQPGGICMAPRIDGVVLSLTDVSVLRAVQQEVVERESQVRMLLESTAEAVIGLDTEERCTFCNPASVRLLGCSSSDELIGRTVDRFIPQGDDKNAIRTVLHTGEGTHFEKILQRPDQSSFVADCWGYPIRRGGRVVGVVLTFLDITNRKKAEEEIRTAARRREEFLAMLSHELRNPLSAVVSAASVMRSPHLSSQTAHQAREIIERQSRHMTRLLDDLLDVTRITRGGIELRKQDVDLRDVIAAGIETLAPVLQERQARVVTETGPDMLAVRGDPDRLQQVIVNLISNAVRYSPSGKPVRISGRIERGMVVLSVKDEGRGIPHNMLSEIFELFVQSDKGLDRAGGGLGIGLTLVRQIVELHGGIVSAHSQGPGTGSEFVVRFPLLQNALIQQTTRVPAPASPCRVVIVEDQDDAREMLRMLLETAGHKVFEAADGLEAAHVIQQEHPDVALLDIGLPGMNGYEVARRIRQNAVFDDVILVALTGYGMESDVKAARDAGFDDHLRKPVDLKAVQEILANRTIRRKAS